MECENKLPSLAGQVDMDDVEFQLDTRSRRDINVVSFAKSSGSLYFNPKMVELLGIANWKQVIAGYDRKSEIIILRPCDPEEYGGVLVRTPNFNKGDGSKKERNEKCRQISVAHLVRSFELQASKHYRAERKGNLVYLQDVLKQKGKESDNES